MPIQTALVVDDDATIRLVMRGVLEKEGFTVIEAEDGEVAVRQYSAHQPDLVIMDIEMPNKDGLTACSEMRAQTVSKVVPILMSTGMDDVESINAAYHAGATDFIVKPLNWKIFSHRVRYLQRASIAIDDFKQAEATAARLGRVIDSSSNEIYIVQLDTLKIIQCNASGLSNLGYQTEELDDLHLFDIFYECTENQIADFKQKCQSRPGLEKMLETNLQRKDKSTYPIEVRIQLSNENGTEVLVAIAQDITERKEAELRMRQLAYYDSLTGLPNRQLFTEQLQLMLNMAEREEFNVAVLFIDLDNFKRINDSLGHTLGDSLLKEIGNRLVTCVRNSDLVSRYLKDNTEISVSRLGGDEFTVVLSHLDEAENAGVVAKRLIAALSRPIFLEGHEIVVTPSIGIAMAPLDGKDVESLLKQADSAMYCAKNSGKNNFQYYCSSMNAASIERLAWEAELRKALERGELELYYQPQIHLETGMPTSLEALIRWNHSERGLVGPQLFIPLAEEMGLIVPIGDWAIEQACLQLKNWQNQGLAVSKVAVNLSSVQFNQPGLLHTIERCLNESGLEPHCLELELTESILMKNAEATVDTLTQLKAMGCGLSVDDFGTGYSSLNYLNQFPLDILKIDKSFVIDVDNDTHNAGIVTAIVAMAKSLELNIVAEGVETEAQLEFLANIGVGIIQGFYFSRPLPANECEALLEHYARNSGTTSPHQPFLRAANDSL